MHLIQAELFDELKIDVYSVGPGQLGENITTRGIDLLALPTGTKLRMGAEVVIELTALRNPCVQIENFQKGLLKAVVTRDQEDNVIRKAGVMGVVLSGGILLPAVRSPVRASDALSWERCQRLVQSGGIARYSSAEVSPKTSLE